MLIIGAVVMTTLDAFGAEKETVFLMLRLTALTSFAIYLLVFVSRPLNQVWKSPLTTNMAKNRHYFGIAFAGAHLVHLALIVTFVFGSGVPLQTLFVGGVAYTLLLLMLITSFDAPAAAIGPVAWRRLHKAGLYWIGGTFTFTLTKNFLAAPDSRVHQAIVVLLVAAIGVRVMAFLKMRSA